jgi:hypothetical protein
VDISRLAARSLTSEFFLSSPSATERAQPPDEFLEINRATATASPPGARSAKQQEEQGKRGKENEVGVGRKGLCNDMVTHSSSNIAIIRDASGLLAICGICRNSLRSIEPEPSLFQMRTGNVIVACEYLG